MNLAAFMRHDMIYTRYFYHEKLYQYKSCINRQKIPLFCNLSLYIYRIYHCTYLMNITNQNRQYDNTLPPPVGTGGRAEWMRGPCACPRRGATRVCHGIPAKSCCDKGQAQGPHPSQHPPPVPTESGTHRC